MGVREPAVDLVELERGHAEVHEDALDAVEPEVRDDVADLVVHRVDRREAVAEASEPLAREGDRLRVPVDADDARRRNLLEDGLRVPTHAERAVDEDRAGRRERGGEEVDAPLEEDGAVAVGRLPLGLVRHAASPLGAMVRSGPVVLGGAEVAGREGSGLPPDQVSHRDPAGAGEVRQMGREEASSYGRGPSGQNGNGGSTSSAVSA